jgi:hypothetical protein
MKSILLFVGEETPDAPFENNNIPPATATPATATPATAAVPSVTPKTTVENKEVINPAQVQAKSTEPVINLTLSELAKLLKENSGNETTDISRILKVIEKGQNANVKNPHGLKNFSSEEVPADDYMEVPVMFFSFNASPTIFDDYKFGRTIPVPYGRPMKFKMISRTKKVGATPHNMAFTTMSAFVTHSQAQADYIRNHSQADVKYFEKIEDAANVDVNHAEALMIASNIYAKYNEHQIKTKAIGMNIKITNPDVSFIRKKLIEKTAKEILRDKSSRISKNNDELIENHKSYEKLKS